MLPCRVPHWMTVNAFGCMLWALGALLGTQSPARAQITQKAGRTAQPAQVEEIYVARSVRESRVAPTENCAQAKTGFNSDAFEDQYTFRSTASRASDGRMVDANIKTIGGYLSRKELKSAAIYTCAKARHGQSSGNTR